MIKCTETQDRPSTGTPALKTQKILIHEMYAKLKISQKLFEDSAIDIESWLLHKVAEKMAALENESFLYGTGDNQPKGILNPSHELESIGFEDAESLISLQDKIHPRYTQHAIWLLSPLALSRVRHMNVTIDPYSTTSNSSNTMYAKEQAGRCAIKAPCVQ